MNQYQWYVDGDDSEKKVFWKAGAARYRGVEAALWEVLGEMRILKQVFYWDCQARKELSYKMTGSTRRLRGGVTLRLGLLWIRGPLNDYVT